MNRPGVSYTLSHRERLRVWLRAFGERTYWKHTTIDRLRTRLAAHPDDHHQAILAPRKFARIRRVTALFELLPEHNPRDILTAGCTYIEHVALVKRHRMDAAMEAMDRIPEHLRGPGMCAGTLLMGYTRGVMSVGAYVEARDWLLSQGHAVPALFEGVKTKTKAPMTPAMQAHFDALEAQDDAAVEEYFGRRTLGEQDSH